MKLSEFKQLIREEIKSVLKEEAPKPRYKKGDRFAYRGMGYTVITDDGYVVKVVDKNGKAATFNYNQLNQGVWKKPDYLNEVKEGLSLEEIPGYKELPEKKEDSGKNSIRLPSELGRSGESSILYSKEEVNKWKNTFMEKWGLQPGEKVIKFADTIYHEILNGSDKYKERLDTSEKAAASFYRDLKYKGD